MLSMKWSPYIWLGATHVEIQCVEILILIGGFSCIGFINPIDIAAGGHEMPWRNKYENLALQIGEV
jgi:hypothetical protein